MEIIFVFMLLMVQFVTIKIKGLLMYLSLKNSIITCFSLSLFSHITLATELPIAIAIHGGGRYH